MSKLDVFLWFSVKCIVKIKTKRIMTFIQENVAAI